MQIAHNVRIGRHCAIAAQVGISGSVEISDSVVIGGQAGIAEHVRIGPKSRVGAQSGVMSVIDAGAVVLGSPARAAPRDCDPEEAGAALPRSGRADPRP